jgi:uncharacterized protein YbbK (DUF523 family)
MKMNTTDVIRINPETARSLNPPRLTSKLNAATDQVWNSATSSQANPIDTFRAMERQPRFFLQQSETNRIRRVLRI